MLVITPSRHCEDSINFYKRRLFDVIKNYYEKNDFDEIFKNLARHRSENNFVGPLK